MTEDQGIMTGRDAFMQNIASRLGRRSPLAEQPVRLVKGVPEHYAAISLTPDEQLELFMRSWGALTGKSLVVKAEEAPQAIAAYARHIAEEVGTSGVAVWEDERFAAMELPQQLAAGGLDIVAWRDDVDGEPGGSRDGEGRGWAPRSRLLHRAERCGLGIVWPEAAIANTGTLVVLTGGGHGRSVSLLPGALLAVFHKDQLVTRMGEAFARIKAAYPDLGDLPAFFTMITGPSRSADIENDLTIGIHGPGKVHAVIIE